MVSTFAQHSFDQRRRNVGQKPNKSWMKCSNGFDMIQLFREPEKEKSLGSRAKV